MKIGSGKERNYPECYCGGYTHVFVIKPIAATTTEFKHRYQLCATVLF